MKDRIKQLRKSLRMSQTEFGARIGVAPNTISSYEKGTRAISDAIVKSICREFGVNESWLRTGEGNMHRSTVREEELGRLAADLLADSPESFRSAFVSTLLRFDPSGPEWAVLEAIVSSLLTEWQASHPPGSPPESKEDPEP